MDDLFTLHPNGLFLRDEALRLGYDDRDLARARNAGLVVRLRQGTYMAAGSWSGDAERQHLLRAQGVALRHGQRVALSHTTGSIAHGLRLWLPQLDLVHVTRLDGTNGRRESDVAYHRDRVDQDALTQLDEMLVIDPLRCALGAAALSSVEGGVVVLDSVLELDSANETALLEAAGRMNRTPFTRPLQVATRLARRGSQSVGESRMRYLFWRHHLPAPVLQYEVWDGGRLVGTCDFAWPQYGLLGEFDGKVKYSRFVRPGEEASDVVFREKRREDLLREATGWPMIRYIYADLARPVQTVARTNRMLRRLSA